MQTFQLTKSKRKNKKFAVTDGEKTIHFGAKGYEDYTTHNDKDRKARYLKRHEKEDWTDINKPGTWARFLLWNLPTLFESARDMERKFKIKINL